MWGIGGDSGVVMVMYSWMGCGTSEVELVGFGEKRTGAICGIPLFPGGPDCFWFVLLLVAGVEWSNGERLLRFWKLGNLDSVSRKWKSEVWNLQLRSIKGDVV